MTPESPSSTILVTHALPYANGSIHIGHLLEAVQTDIYVRARRLEGDNVVFVCADDTHGTPIEINAQKAGMTPEAFVARFASEHVRDYAKFRISYDAFHSTNSEENRRWAHYVYKKLLEGGHVKRRTIEQLYDQEAKRFLPDRFVKGTCPKCGAADQYGDVCENCGSTYEPRELVDPYSVVTGSRPVLRSSEHLFVELASFAEYLQGWVDTPDRLQPEVRRFVQEWIDKGLQDWDISRDAPYFGFEIPDAPGKFFYVWLDAPIGYISATEHWAGLQGRRKMVHEIWSAGSAHPAEIVHVIGKDIIYFHTLFWPAMLKASELRTPVRVQVHGMLTANGAKMSKSRGTFILAETFARHLEPTYLRWYLGAKLSSGIDDIDFSTDEFVQRVNAELVNNLANLVSRGASFLHNKLGGRTGTLPAETEELLALARARVAAARKAYKNWDTARAVRAGLDIADAGNLLFQEKAPWKMVKADPEAARSVVTLGLNLAKAAAIVLAPVVPEPCDKILSILQVDRRHFQNALNFDIKDGRSIGPMVRIIERVDPKAMERVVEESAGPEPEPAAKAPAGKARAASASEASQTITTNDLFKVDLRAGRVLEAERVEGADKLLRLRVDIGEGEPRQIFAGLAEAYRPQELVGRHVVVVANLKPRKMRFGTSEGMILAAGPGGKDIQVLSVDEGASPGSRIQ
ncbi:MAG: methionine--tRNA ligase [Myxococcota bacterium]